MKRSTLLTMPALLLALLLALPAMAQRPGKEAFVQVQGTQFIKNGQPYTYLGTNLWYGMYLGMPGPQGDRERLIKELDALQALGITNLRVLGASEGHDSIPYKMQPTLQPTPGQFNETLLQGLDFLLVEMAKRNMHAVVFLSNYWMWSGGFPVYVHWATGEPIPFPNITGGGTWDPFIKYSHSFYTNKKANKYYRATIKKLVNRRNSITGLKYKQDPTIMAWQLANEPRGNQNPEDLRAWIHRSARYINRLDGQHLICTGTEGNTAKESAGVDLYKDNQSKFIDYATTHLWIQNWGWYNPQAPESFETAMKEAEQYLASQLAKARQLGKPVTLEEFGVSRDGASYDPATTVNYRNAFYEAMFKATLNSIQAGSNIQGCNFWSWGGAATPKHPGQLWQPGDAFIGDPAHERQGWYSVYSTDATTLDLIRRYATLINTPATTADTH